MPLGSVLQLITILVLLVIVIVMAYYVSKWLAGYQKTLGTGGNIEVIESCRIAPSKFIVIVRVGAKYLALGIGKDETSFLAELDKEDLVIRSAGEAGQGAFAGVLKKIRRGNEKQG